MKRQRRSSKDNGAKGLFVCLFKCLINTFVHVFFIFHIYYFLSFPFSGDDTRVKSRYEGTGK